MPNAVRTSVYPAMIGSLNRTLPSAGRMHTARSALIGRGGPRLSGFLRDCRDCSLPNRLDGLRFHDGNVGPRRMHAQELESTAAEQFAVLLARALLPAQERQHVDVEHL